MTTATATSPIRTLRREKGLTAEQLAARAGLASATVYRAERGIGTPGPETLQAIARVLKVAVADLHGVNGATDADARGKGSAQANGGRAIAVESNATPVQSGG